MHQRQCNPLKTNSFFLFGARGTGKSTLVAELLSSDRCLLIDLLRPEDEERYAQDPYRLIPDIEAQVGKIDWVIIDQVQKLPKLLDAVHYLMESKSTKGILFALTGSSARKLKVAGANLLAGRAFVNELHPLTHIELRESFDLDAALNWGTLPKIVSLTDSLSKQEFLRTYSRTYIKEEIWDERLVHQLDPFRKFLEIAAQANGTILNFSNIGRDAGIDDKTAKKYFEILADTFLGFYLESYHRSVRKQQLKAPKFYIFDPGVKRAMEGMLNVPVARGTYAYGRAFEHFLLCECVRLNAYLRLNYRFYYLRTKGNLEVDLIIERPGQPTAVIEIKSAQQVDERDTKVLSKFVDDFPSAEFYLWSQDPRPQVFGQTRALPWQTGLAAVGLIPKNPL